MQIQTKSGAGILRLAFLLFLAAAPVLAAESITNIGDMADFRDVIAQAKREVFPSVVFLMPIAERYDAGRAEKTQVAGSGVIISPEGEIVTNWHVVDKAVEIRCLLYDGSAYRATIVGVDKDTDLALLKLDAPGGTVFPFAELADSAHLEEGTFVMAMGAPWGLSRSVSMGILSCVNRFLSDQGGGYNLWLQTDASINPGNSGGPLIDTDGKVVGINSLGVLLGGDLAFAVPADTVKDIVPRLRRDGRVIRAWTGLHVQPLKDFEKNIFYEGNQGVLISGVDPESPAGEAGMHVGQLLLEVNGTAVAGINHEDIPPINQFLADLAIGQVATMVLADAVGTDDRQEYTITPMEKGVVEGTDFDCRRWNMTIKTINEFANPMLHFFRPGGIYVQGIRYPGNAGKAGLRSGDILIEADGVPIRDLEHCRSIYETIVGDDRREKKVVFCVLRAGLRTYLVLDYGPRYGRD